MALGKGEVRAPVEGLDLAAFAQALEAPADTSMCVGPGHVRRVNIGNRLGPGQWEVTGDNRK